MILRQLAEGRCEVENQYGRVVPYEGNLRALQVMAEVFALRPHFEWRGLGFISQSALRLSDAYRDLDAEVRFSVPGVRVADPKACQCGEVLKGVIKPWECKVFGTACTPDHADRHVHGLARGRLRRVLQLRALRARAGGRVMRARRPHTGRARATRPDPHRDGPRPAAEVPRRAHHDGARRRRQGDADADRGPARAGLRVGRAGGARRRRACSPSAAPSLAFTTDSFVVKPIRFPGGSIGELAVNGTVNDLAMAGARPLAITLAMVLEEGLAAADLRAEVEAIARRRGRPPACRSSPATRRWSSAATATRMYLTTAGIGLVDERAALSPAALRAGRPDPALGHDRRPRHGDHAGPRRVRPRRHAWSRTRARCGPPPTRCSERRRTRRCTACATRRAAASRRC